MYVEDEIISAAADLIQGSLDNGLPVQDEAELQGFDTEQTTTLRNLTRELDRGDLCAALRQAAARLPEPVDGDEDCQQA